jgi:hypothetical protein
MTQTPRRTGISEFALKHAGEREVDCRHCAVPSCNGNGHTMQDTNRSLLRHAPSLPSPRLDHSVTSANSMARAIAVTTRPRNQGIFRIGYVVALKPIGAKMTGQSGSIDGQ